MPRSNCPTCTLTMTRGLPTWGSPRRRHEALPQDDDEVAISEAMKLIEQSQATASPPDDGDGDDWAECSEPVTDDYVPKAHRPAASSTPATRDYVPHYSAVIRPKTSGRVLLTTGFVGVAVVVAAVLYFVVIR